MDYYLSHAGVKGMKWGVRKDGYSSGNSSAHRGESSNKTVVKKSRNGKVTKISNTADNSKVKIKKTRRGAKVVAKHNNIKVKTIISNSTAVAAGALRVAAAFVPGAGALSGVANAAALVGTVANVVIK